MIDGIAVETDEDGFELVLEGDFTAECTRYLNTESTKLRLRLPQDAAVELLAACRGKIVPWLEDAHEAWESYSRATPEERARVLTKEVRADG